jgi:DNA-binding response OmpR family regulator
MLSGGDAAGSFFYVLEDPIRILFADDDPILREFAVVHLSTQAAKVDVAEDGIKALDVLNETDCDILLLDLEMPRLDGFEVLKQLRSSEKYRRLPIIVVTGREDVAAIDRAFAEGASAFTVKPINWRLLSYQIRFVHRSAEAEAELRIARAGARAEVTRAMAAVRRLATEGATFLRQALTRSPELRPAAEAFADAVDHAALVGEAVAEAPAAQSHAA